MHLLSRWREYRRQRRLEHYAQHLRDHPLDAGNSAVITGRLTRLWRLIDLSDLRPLSPTLASLLQMEVWTYNLPTLLEHLTVVNQYIREEKDSRVERLNYELVERHQVSVDFYLADNNQLAIDLPSSLSRLYSALQEHHVLLLKNAQENQYYQRLCTKLYQDVIELTETLIEYNRSVHQ